MAAELTAADPRDAAPADAGTGRSTVRPRVPVRRRRRAPDWLVALGVAAVAAAVAAVAQWRGTFFYYGGDARDQFLPLWHLFGEQLRAGSWPTMDPAGWMGGNYAAEGLDGIWNPVALADYVLVSAFDQLNVAAFLVMAQFLAVLAAGAYLLAREHGAARPAAVLVGVAVPFTGFTLFYEAGGWPMGLMAFAWTTHFWWSARRFARGRTSPLVPFLFGALTMTTGNPYGALGMLVVLLALGVELALARRWDRLVHLAVTGACVGAIALLVYLPLLGAGAVTDRATVAGLGNDAFLVPGAGDLLAGSAPTYTPAIVNWGGAAIETVPSTYLAWFVLPLLPWLRWRPGLARVGRRAVSLWIVAGFYLLAVLGPSNLWLFRWPVRVVEYLYLAVLVLFAVVVSAGPAPGRVRRRAGASAVLVLAGSYLAWAVRPVGLGGAHAVGLVLVLALVALAVWAWTRRGPALLALVGVVGTVLVVVVQAGAFPAPVPVDRVPVAAAPDTAPADLAQLRAAAEPYRGTVLQLATLPVASSEQRQNGRLLFGNLPRVTGVESVVSYTGMGFEAFQQTLCIDYMGRSCPQAFDRLWAPAGPAVPVPLVDAMRVSTLVVQRSLRPDVATLAPPAGWHVALRDDVRTVWVRDRPLDGRGRVSWTDPGIALDSDVSVPQQESVRYSAASAGRVLFARLAWPGYSATVDGRPAAVRTGPAGLLLVDVPAGQHRLVVSYTTPGLRVGAVAALGGAAVVAVQTAVELAALVRRQRRRTVVAGEEGR